MSDVQTNLQPVVPGFWRRLALAVETMGEAAQEPLERRIARLETEVEHLSEIQKDLSRR